MGTIMKYVKIFVASFIEARQKRATMFIKHPYLTHE